MPKSPIQHNTQLTTEYLEDSDISVEEQWDTPSERNSEVSESSEYSVDDVNDGIYYQTVAAASAQAKEEKTATTLAPAGAEASNEEAPAQAKEEETATTEVAAGAEGTSAENTNSSIWEIRIQCFGRILDSLRECFRSSDVNSNNAEEEKLPAVNNNDGRNLASTTNTHNVSNFFSISTSEPEIRPVSQNSFNS